MKNLISMTDFVLEQKETIASDDITQADWYDIEAAKLEKIRSYANFLKQPLTLGQFVPCDLDGNVLKEPLKKYFEIKGNTECNGWQYLVGQKEDKFIGYYDFIKWNKEYFNYKKAKQRVLFNVDAVMGICNNKTAIHIDGFSALIISEDFKNKTIENLCSWNLELTESAIKQIGL